MEPKLIGVAGPVKGVTFTLSDQEFSIGREPANSLPIDDRQVSRRHCFIKREAAQFKITDLDSGTGTFVNDLPVNERPLGHGDQIKIGKSVFLFLTDETASIPARSHIG